jgi:hypothetical protein
VDNIGGLTMKIDKPYAIIIGVLSMTIGVTFGYILLPMDNNVFMIVREVIRLLFGFFAISFLVGGYFIFYLAIKNTNQ